LAKTKIFSAVQEYEMAMIMAETRQATTVSGYGWEQGASYSSRTPSPSTSIQSTPMTSPHCTPATSGHITQPPSVSTAATQLVTESH
jgi:hypothetical protein